MAAAAAFGKHRAFVIPHADVPAAIGGHAPHQHLEGAPVDAALEGLVDEGDGQPDPLVVALVQRLVQRARGGLVDHDPGKDQHDHHDPRQDCGEADRERPSRNHGVGSRVAARRYPVAGTVSISQGAPGSSSSLRRRFATWTSTTRS